MKPSSNTNIVWPPLQKGGVPWCEYVMYDIQLSRPCKEKKKNTLFSFSLLSQVLDSPFKKKIRQIDVPTRTRGGDDRKYLE